MDVVTPSGVESKKFFELHKKPQRLKGVLEQASVEEIAYPILRFASDEASFITGTIIMVDVGKSAM